MKRIVCLSIVLVWLFSTVSTFADVSVTQKIQDIYQLNPADNTKLQKINEILSQLDKNIPTYKTDKLKLLLAKIFLQIWLDLNHQKMELAKKVFESYAKDENFIKATAIYWSYSDYVTLLQLKKYYSQATDVEMREMFTLRMKYYPNEENNAKFQTIMHPNFSLDCTKLIKEVSGDTIDIAFCNLYNNKYTKNDLAMVMQLPQDQQILSDQMNYYGSLWRKSKEDESKMLTLEAKNAIALLKLDNQHVNGYITLLQDVYKDDCEQFNIWYKEFQKNCSGDSDGYKQFVKDIKPNVKKCQNSVKPINDNGPKF